MKNHYNDRDNRNDRNDTAHESKNNTPKYGLEYSYNSDLMGQDGKCLFLHKPGAGKIKVKDSHNLESPLNVYGGRFYGDFFHKNS